MAKYKNIQQYRTRKKIKSAFKTIIVLAIILTILVVLSNVLQLFKGTNISDIIGKELTPAASTFPITIKNEQLLDIHNVGSSVTVLSKSSLMTYLENGKRTNKSPHGYTNPVVVEGGKRVLTYDRGGTGFRLDNNSSMIASKTAGNQIMSANIARNGNVLVVTNHERFASLITVYDSTLTEIYKYSSSDAIMMASFSPDSKNVVAASVTTKEGVLSTLLLELKIDENTAAKKTYISDVLPLDVNYSGNSAITIIGSEMLVSIDTKTQLQTQYIYKGDIEKFSSNSLSQSIIVTKNLGDNKSTLTVIGSDAVEKKSIEINDTVKDIYCDESKIVVLCADAAYNFDINLIEKDMILLSKSYNKIVFNGGFIFLLGVESIEKFEIS